MSWKVYQTIDGAHVIPLNDRKAHTLSTRCDCEPSTEAVAKRNGTFGGFIVIHNAFDGREFQEEQDAAQHS